MLTDRWDIWEIIRRHSNVNARPLLKRWKIDGIRSNVGRCHATRLKSSEEKSIQIQSSNTNRLLAWDKEYHTLEIAQKKITKTTLNWKNRGVTKLSTTRNASLTQPTPHDDFEIKHVHHARIKYCIVLHFMAGPSLEQLLIFLSLFMTHFKIKILYITLFQIFP